MTPDDRSSTPTDRILAALASGDKSKGDLLDASELRSYSELDPVLNALIAQQRISLHWADRSKQQNSRPC